MEFGFTLGFVIFITCPNLCALDVSIPENKTAIIPYLCGMVFGIALMILCSTPY